MLLVVLVVHEDVRLALGVQVLHRPTVEFHLLDFLTRAQALLDDRALLDVPDLDLHERAQVAGGHVGVLGDDVQLAIHLDGHAGA